jgi:hypothetical protein
MGNYRSTYDHCHEAAAVEVVGSYHEEAVVEAGSYHVAEEAVEAGNCHEAEVVEAGNEYYHAIRDRYHEEEVLSESYPAIRDHYHAGVEEEAGANEDCQ